MREPRRGEVWRLDFSGSYAYEMVGDTTHYHNDEKLIPCLIISDDKVNEQTGTFTILGNTTRRNRVGRPGFDIGIMRQWSVLITREPDNRWMRAPVALIDCDKLWTTSRSQRSHYIGTLAEKDMIHIKEMLFRVFTGNGMPRPRHKPFEDGTIIKMDFGGQPEPFLVVSSSEWDALRYRSVGTCTVVKLEPGEVYDPDNPLQSVLDVKIQSTGIYDKFTAVCSDVYTLQWNPNIGRTSGMDRRMREIGIADQEQLFDVADKLLRRYLGLIMRS
jgi:mRNA-degrading endonuclease toxin of MazEF toxin-antitoxin module